MNENSSLIYKIGLVIVSVILIVFLVLFVVYYKRASRTDSYIDTRVAEATSVKESEMEQSCELQKREIQENPWVSYTAPNLVGAFTFNYPRSWSRHQIFDISSQTPYISYFNPDFVAYDASVKEIHSALEVSVSKNLYAKELEKYEKKAKEAKEKYEITDITISEFGGRKFYYKDKDTQTYVYVVIIPFRDRTLTLKTDNARDYVNYFDQFANSFILTP